MKGNHFLVEKLINTINVTDSDEGIVIDSIKNDGECNTLKQFPYFYLFSVHADEKLRYERTLKAKKFKAGKEFNKVDSRDQAEEIHYGQQVKKCNYLSDIIINNNQNIPQQAARAKKQLIDTIYNKYISLIQYKKKGLLTPDNLPSIDETLMTMAYAESKRSSCLKRKVGALITSIDKGYGKGTFDQSIKESVHILSSGYNEVPFGLVPCIFNKDYEKCYRDFLQEEQAKSIKHCPSCGKKIKLPTTKCKAKDCNFKTSEFLKVCPKCKNELDVKYICPKCKVDISRVFNFNE